MVKQGRFFRGPALLVKVGNFNFPGVLIFGDAYNITHLDVFTGFTTLTIDVNLAAVDGIGSQVAGFKKPRSPQPFINPNLIDLSQAANHSPPRL